MLNDKNKTFKAIDKKRIEFFLLDKIQFVFFSRIQFIFFNIIQFVFFIAVVSSE